MILNKPFDIPYFINTIEFSREAQHFLKYGFYTNALEGTYMYDEYWEEQRKRCLEGYTSNGVRITGLHYFYLNFYQIKATIDEGGRKRKVLTFPRFLDMDYLYFHEIEQANLNNQGLIVAKARRKGFSFKNSALCAHQYTFYRDSTSIIGAYLNEYAESTMSMSLEALNFINANTAWYKRRNPDTRDYIKARFKEIEDGKEIWKGYNSEIYTLTFKDNDSAAIGKSSSVFLFEEAGKWIGLINSYMITAPCFRDGDYMTGFPFVFGCVCEGTKVWTKTGNLINVENLKQEEGIIGHDNEKASKEDIIWMQPPAEKDCYKITTNTGTELECSYDHPLLWSKQHYNYVERKPNGRIRKIVSQHKKVKFVETKDIKIGEQIAVINAVPIFEDVPFWEARTVGMLIGDGSYEFDKTPVLSNCDKEIIKYIENKFETKTEKQYLTNQDKIYKEIRIKNICGELRNLKIYGQTKTRKRLPESIFRASKKDVCDLIAGLIDTDGYIGKQAITITASGKLLLQDVKNLLYKIGVHCSINEVQDSREYNDKIKCNNIYYRLNIGDKTSIFNLAKNITLLCEYKQKDLQNLLNLTKNIRGTHNAVFVEKNKQHKKYVNITDVEGLRFEQVKNIEYIGKKTIYNLNAGNTHTYIANGIITHNTGGDVMNSSSDFCEMFYNPEKYWLRAYNNEYDEGCDGNSCGLFIDDRFYKPGKVALKKDTIDFEVYPELMGYFKTDKKDESVTVEMVDEEGNSNRDVANYYLDIERENIKKSDSKSTWEKYITQSPKTPKEAFLKTGGNLFPTVELSKWLGVLETDKTFRNLAMLGDLYWEGQNVKWRPNPSLKPINKFPLKDGDASEGCIVIYEHPYKDENGEIPYGLYIAGCLPPGEKVMTTNGLKNIENVTSNEELYDVEGNITKIDAFTRYYVENEKIYNLKVCNTYRTTKFTKEHPILASVPKIKYNSKKKQKDGHTQSSKEFNFDFIECKDLTKNHWVKIPNIYKKEYQIDTTLWKNNGRIDRIINNPLLEKDFWWFIGLFLGDGWTDKNHKINIAFDLKNEISIIRCKKLIKELFKRNYYARIKNGSLEISMCFTELKEFIDIHFEKGAENKRIPEWVKYMNPIFKTELISGYLSSDGCVVKNKNLYTTEFVSINLELLESIQDMLFSLNIISGISLLRDIKTTKIQGKLVNQKKAYHLRLNNFDTIQLYKLVSDNEKLQKIPKKYINSFNKTRNNKDCLLVDGGKFICMRITDIENSIYSGMVYSFKTKSSTFMCHHLPTHNTDPYAQDTANSSVSLGSTFIYKTFQKFDKTYQIIVAEYTARPELENIYNDNLIKLLTYYNAKTLYENNIKGLKIYFEQKKCLHLLKEQPKILKDIVKDSTTQRGYGIHMSEPIKRQCEIYIRDWLLTKKCDSDGVETEQLNLHSIYSIPLLQELIAYDSKQGNFDRVISFALCILHENENYHVRVDSAKEKKFKEAFWNQKSTGINNRGRLSAFV